MRTDAGPRAEELHIAETLDLRGPRDLAWRLEAAACQDLAADGKLAGATFHPARLLESEAIGEVRFNYTADHGAAPRFAMSLSATLSDLTHNASHEAEAAEGYMRRGLAGIGKRARFVQAPSVVTGRLPHRAVLQPLAFALQCAEGRAAPGFRSGVRRPSPTCVLASPPLVARGGVNSFARLAEAVGGQMQMRLAYRRVRLTADELEALATALTALNRVGNLQWPLNGTSRQHISTAESGEVARVTLTRWLHRPTGYRVTCEIACDGPLNRAHVVDVAAELLPGWQITTAAADAEWPVSPPTALTLDLTACINDSDPLPGWLPDSTSLTRARVARHYPAPDADLSSCGITLGTVGGNIVRLGDEDRLRHLYVCGATGTGKSTLLYNMAVQDIESGHGVCVVDPHGDLHAALLRSIPSRRLSDVVVIDPTVEDWSVGLNFLECTGANRRMQVGYIVNEVVKIFESLYDMRLVGGPMFEQYMRNALLLLLQADGYDDATLVDVNRVFEDREFRRSLLTHCSDPIVAGFWSRQAERAGGEAALSNMAPYVTSKLNQFVTNPLLRPLIGQPRSTIDLREVMDSGKILLVNLARGRLGRLDSHLLGMLVLGRVFLAALSRADVDVASRRPFSLYVDEFQNVITETTAQALAESRKYGLCLTLANQTLSQIEGTANKLLEAVLGNCGSFAFFRLGAPDAERLERYSRPDLSAMDLQELPDFHVATRLLVGGRPLRSFVFTADAPKPVSGSAAPELVLATALRRYASPIDDVEEGIRRRWAADPFASGTTTEPQTTGDID